MSEALTAANPNNSSAHHMLASPYAQLGRGHASLAENATAPSVSNKSAGGRRFWYQKSPNIWQDLKAKGKLIGADAGKVDEVNRELEKCGSALERL